MPESFKSNLHFIPNTQHHFLPTMPLTTSIVTDEADIPELSIIDYEGWQNPYNPQLKHFRPKFNSRDDWITWYTKTRVERIRDPNPNPNRFHVKCVDGETNRILGYAIWVFVDDPVGKVEPVKALWHPEGSDEREFAERFINGLVGFMGGRVSRPHMDLGGLVVHPDHRMRGVGRLLIRWGIDKADELGVETIVSSLKSARGAYEKSGLGATEIIPPNRSLNVENPSETWRKLQEDDLEGWLMWRPVGHDYVEGVDKAPWL